MNASRFASITSHFAKLRVAVVGDFCLDRYLEIDPRKNEISIETGLPVHNVTNVRSQPGGAGTILNNLVALGIGEIYPVGFAGEDGEGFELRRALEKQANVRMEFFISTKERRTFTYTKPLVMKAGATPRELNRLDLKNWRPTPPKLQREVVEKIKAVAARVDAVILLDQVDISETGVVTKQVLKTIADISKSGRGNKPLFLADSRRGLRKFPPVIFKMNAAELVALAQVRKGRLQNTVLPLPKIKSMAAGLASKNKHPVFVTLSERGIVGALPDGEVEHISALPVRGEIDVVGAGDAVTANLTAALAAGASLSEALELANAAASVVVHKLGTTGTANVKEIKSFIL